MDGRFIIETEVPGVYRREVPDDRPVGKLMAADHVGQKRGHGVNPLPGTTTTAGAQHGAHADVFEIAEHAARLERTAKPGEDLLNGG